MKNIIIFKRNIYKFFMKISLPSHNIKLYKKKKVNQNHDFSIHTNYSLADCL